MKFVERGSNTFTIEGLKRQDVKYSNLAARPTNSIYYDPERPQHVLAIWIDQDVAKHLLGAGFNVKEADDTYNELGMRPYIQFKAYPKKRVNPMTGKEEQSPKVILQTAGNSVRLNAESFGLVDAAQIEQLNISFHSWSYDDKRPPVAVLDGVWCTADESAGGRNDYFDDAYGYQEPNFVSEEVPFE